MSSPHYNEIAADDNRVYLHVCVHVLADEIHKARCQLLVSPVSAPDCSHPHLSAPLVKVIWLPREINGSNPGMWWSDCAGRAIQDLGVNTPYVRRVYPCCIIQAAMETCGSMKRCQTHRSMMSTRFSGTSQLRQEYYHSYVSNQNVCIPIHIQIQFFP